MSDAKIVIKMRKCQFLEIFNIDKRRSVELIGLWLLVISLLKQHRIGVDGKQSYLKTNPANLKVVFAVNAGGKEHTDTHGIHYDSDPLKNKIGTASDYGNNLLIIGRVTEHDETLYRTERYHTATFGYDIPLDGDGDYALILKFCEVYFNEPNKKVFDIVLNKQHKIVSQLDIFHEVGHGTAHEEYAFFAVVNGQLYYNGDVSDIKNNMVRLDFVKGVRDNPKINAFALLKGDVQHIPRLKPISDVGDADDDIAQFDDLSMQGFQRKQSTPPGYNQKKLNQMVAKHTMKIEKDEIIRGAPDTPAETDFPDVLDFFDDQDMDELSSNSRNPSGPPHPNPYEMHDVIYILPLFVAMAAFVPMLYCLCKL